MKRKLLFVSSLILFTSTLVCKAQSADFDFYFTKYTTTQLNTWKGGAKATGITLNGITAYIPSTGRPNNFVFGADNGFMRGRMDNDANMVILESPTALRKVALRYYYGGMKITYGPAAPDTTGLGPVFGPLVIADWRSTLITKNGANQTTTDLAPGVVNFFNVNDNPNGETKYVEIVRVFTSTGNGGTGQSTRLFEIAASTSDFTALPLEFTSFTAKTDLIRNAVNLNWTTAKEVNTKEFVVERGNAAGEFTAVGSVKSANSVGEHNYSFVDETAPVGTSYYRIKQVDNDGQFAYSDVEEVFVKGNGVSLSAYPNPTSDVLKLAFVSASNASLKVLNVQGQTVLSQGIATGATNLNLNVATLASGVYTLVVTNNGSQSITKFVKN